MPKANQIPSRVTNFNVYFEDKRLAGVATIDLPEPERMNDEVTGAGIGGSLNMPLPGHFESMTTTINFNVPTKDTFRLFSGGSAHLIDCRASIQVYDASNGAYIQMPLRVSMLVSSKNVALGTLEPNAKTDTGSEFAVNMIKMWLDGKVVCHIDPANMISEIDGIDELADVRKNIGM